MAVSASVSGYISMVFFKHDMVMVRKCTIIGMSAGLSAFFGVQLGGKLSPALVLAVPSLLQLSPALVTARKIQTFVGNRRRVKSRWFFVGSYRCLGVLSPILYSLVKHNYRDVQIDCA